MEELVFDEFVRSLDTLRFCNSKEPLFPSSKDSLKPVLEYVAKKSPHEHKVKIFDKVVGNAAALLALLHDCGYYSPLASILATQTLNRYNVKYSFAKVIPDIQARDRKGYCPMEKLSLKKL